MKKNIIKSVIALSFVIGAIVSFNVEANAFIKEDGGCGCVADDPGECVATATCDNGNTVCCVGINGSCTSGSWWVDCGYGQSTCI